MSETLAQHFISWAQTERSVRALVLIGSRARHNNEPGAADIFSDWDFQIVTRRPSMFATPGWLERTALPKPLAYAKRTGRLGHSEKISAVFETGELDVVLIPSFPISAVRLMSRAGIGLSRIRTNPRLAGLALVLQSGYRVLKGSKHWEDFFATIATRVCVPRLTDQDVYRLAEAFLCDFVSVQQKLRRGEIMAAQRWLHCNLGEVNFQLLHELRTRQGQASFPDARRIERICDEWNEAVTISAIPERMSLAAALAKSAETFRELMHALVGNNWRWPDLPSRLRTE